MMQHQNHNPTLDYFCDEDQAAIRFMSKHEGKDVGGLGWREMCAMLERYEGNPNLKAAHRAAGGAA